MSFSACQLHLILTPSQKPVDYNIKLCWLSLFFTLIKLNGKKRERKTPKSVASDFLKVTECGPLLSGIPKEKISMLLTAQPHASLRREHRS